MAHRKVERDASISKKQCRELPAMQQGFLLAKLKANHLTDWFKIQRQLKLGRKYLFNLGWGFEKLSNPEKRWKSSTSKIIWIYKDKKFNVYFKILLSPYTWLGFIFSNFWHLLSLFFKYNCLASQNEGKFHVWKPKMLGLENIKHMIPVKFYQKCE